MAPSPLLYTASPIVPDQQENEAVSAKLTVEVADKTLGLIEEVLESGKASAQKKVKKSTRKRDSVKEWIKSSSVSVLMLVAFLAVLVSGIVDLATEVSECALLSHPSNPCNYSDSYMSLQLPRTLACLPLHVGAMVHCILAGTCCSGLCSFICYSYTDRPAETQVTFERVIE